MARPRHERTPDPVASARSAGLRYVSDRKPGFRREKGALGFRYMRDDGRLVRNAADLKRIRALGIPPAWTSVWICRDPKGHLQATGRDARGRKQYRYHADWRVSRDETKFDRMQAFAAALPTIRARTSADIARAGLSREKVLATVVQLLEKSLIRVGNEEYAKANGSFGLTTMRDQHVEVKGATLRFEFRGKSGKRHSVGLSNRRLARVVKQCRDIPGYELFQYIDEAGGRQDVDSADVNAYLHEITDDEFTAKDFRTWSATVLAATALREFEKPASMTQAKKDVGRAIEAVAAVLGNTPSVCRKSYIHPAVIDAYVDGSIGELRPSRRFSKLRSDEAAALRLLQQLARAPARRRKAA